MTVNIDPRPMQAAWATDGYAAIDWFKVSKYQMRRLYLDARYMTKAQVDAIHAHTVGVSSTTTTATTNTYQVEAGIYWGAGWLASENITTPEQLAKRISDICTTVAPGNSQLAVMIDLEHIAPLETIDFTLATLQVWRKLRPGKWTSWTMEPMQGPSFTRELVDFINADVNLVVVPQHYGGAMQPFAADVVLRDLLLQGVALERVQGFYDGAALPVEWRGCVYDLGRLP